jgi:hypothetical protein
LMPFNVSEEDKAKMTSSRFIEVWLYYYTLSLNFRYVFKTVNLGIGQHCVWLECVRIGILIFSSICLCSSFSDPDIILGCFATYHVCCSHAFNLPFNKYNLTCFSISLHCLFVLFRNLSNMMDKVAFIFPQIRIMYNMMWIIWIVLMMQRCFQFPIKQFQFLRDIRS